MQNPDVLHGEGGVDYIVIPPEASYPLTEAGIEDALRKVIASWKHRAEGHEAEENAPIAFKFVVSFEINDLEETRNIAGGVALTKTWRKLLGSFGMNKEKAKQAHLLKKWTLIISPLVPVDVWSVVIESIAADQFMDPVTELYNPAEAPKTEGCTTLHFLRRQDAMRFVEMSVAVLD